MEPFDNLILKIQDFKNKALSIALSSIEDNKNTIIEMNIYKIHSQGKTIQDKPINRKDKDYPVYSEPYTKRKINLGIYQGFVDLSLDGKYLRSYKLRIEGTLIYIEGEKTVRGFDLADFIRDKYGDVEGLSDNNWQEIAEKYITPKLYNEILMIW